MSLPSMSVAAPKLETAVLKYELFPDYCRGAGTLLAGDGAKRTVDVGRVLGKILRGEVAVTKTDVGGGKGAITLANPAIADGAPAGDYRLAIIEPASNAGTFVVFRPDGTIDGSGNVAAAYDGTVKFTWADAADFAAGDIGKINVTYAAGSGKIVEFDEDNTDGSEVPFAIALKKTVAPDGIDAPIMYLERGPAIVAASQIEWPTDITDGEKESAIAVLEAKGIRFVDD